VNAAKAVVRDCWCGATTAHAVGTFESGHTLVQCDGCGVQALHPQPGDAELAAAYSREYYGLTRRKFIAPIAAMVGAFQDGRARRVSRLVGHEGSRRILDVGCGNGGFLMQMKRRGFEVEGTEWTADAAARIPHAADFPIHVGDLIEMNLSPQSFDAVTLWHVFEHLRQPRETLARIHSLLKPGGVLLMSMPNVESAQAQRYGTHWFHHDPPRHLFGFGPHSITLLLENSGFRVERLGTWSFEQNPFGGIQSRLNERGFSRDRLYSQLKGLSRERFRTRLADFTRMLLLLPWALVKDLIDSTCDEGATMTVEARRVDHERHQNQETAVVVRLGMQERAR
jgi:SAM-dependent methyltransferase